MRGEERGAREASRFGTLPRAVQQSRRRPGWAEVLPESRHALSTWLHAARIAATQISVPRPIVKKDSGGSAL